MAIFIFCCMLVQQFYMWLLYKENQRLVKLLSNDNTNNTTNALYREV